MGKISATQHFVSFARVLSKLHRNDDDDGGALIVCLFVCFIFAANYVFCFFACVSQKIMRMTFHPCIQFIVLFNSYSVKMLTFNCIFVAAVVHIFHKHGMTHCKWEVFVMPL